MTKPAILLGILLIAAACVQSPPGQNATNQANATNVSIPPGYEVADYCKTDSDCVRLNRCCDCGLGVYVNKYSQKAPDCTVDPVCECATIESTGKCENSRCVGVPVETPPSNATPPRNGTNATYSPLITPADFTANVTNKYFSLTPRKKMVYEGETQDGTERIEVYVMNATKTVQGVETIVVWDRVWLDGELVEDTLDWYAQDKEGNVWYFGEETKELAGGMVVSTAGSWEAGVDGAKPGIIMKAAPVPGDSYRQEYFAGEAEDMADVLSVSESVSVPYGSFTGCLKTYDWTPLDLSAKEHKYYCAGPGGVAMEVVLEDNETTRLISVEYGAEPSPSAPEEPGGLVGNITEDEAKAIALAEVSGEVTSISIERKSGRLVYVVEVAADSGPETDVFIDIETGEVIAVET
ncbi:MAG: PepSY domain-containing protein [Candidatus Micrarchaeota archaeon]